MLFYFFVWIFFRYLTHKYRFAKLCPFVCFFFLAEIIGFIALWLKQFFLLFRERKWRTDLLDVGLRKGTVFENHRKSHIQHCERSELRLHFEWPKVHKNAKNGQFCEFLEIAACGQTMLPDRSTFNKTKIGGKCRIFH